MCSSHWQEAFGKRKDARHPFTPIQSLMVSGIKVISISKDILLQMPQNRECCQVIYLPGDKPVFC